MQVFALAATVIVWAVVHSLLASTRMKAFARRMLGPATSRGYRLAYNVVSVISLAPAAWLMWRIKDHQLYSIPLPWSLLMLAVQVLAVLLTALTLLQTNALQFAGLAQVLGRSERSELVVTGFYAIVRHPLYLFGLLFLWFSPRMTVNQLVVTIILTAYLLIGAVLEEQRLQEEFGEAYRAYRLKTPMMVPRILRR